MIVEWLLELAAAVVSALVALVPEVNWGVESFQEVAYTWGTALGGFNAYTPVTAIFGAALVLFGVWAVMAVWNLIAFIYHQFWGSS